ncbi:MAG: hypothetical protein CMM08_08055 [Rhodospirillaceae bacterium]|jgi:uncharacterized membrane protein|nr:hypothetical protein [Rhodospirillaceae bacterium]|tara:strand:- start:2332 stop:2799 length:468 start_codon:yes stop_codon:yes gene_type:complete
MDDLTFARALHVLGVVVWVGGLYFVTFIVLPVARTLSNQGEDGVDLFEKAERRFTFHARVTVLLTGFSGFYMLHLLDAWERYLHIETWAVHAMTVLWLVFFLAVFIAEPLFLHRWFMQKAAANPSGMLRQAAIFHRLMIVWSLFTIAVAMFGAHA